MRFKKMMNVYGWKFALCWLLVCIGCVGTEVCGQVPESEKTEKDKTSFKDILSRTTVGLEMSLWGFDEQFYMEASPAVDYRLSPNTYLSAHMVIQLIEDLRFGKTYTSSSYGARLVARRRVVSNFGIHAEAERVFHRLPDQDGNATPRQGYNTARIGAYGLQELGERASVSISVLFDLDWQRSRSVQPSPFVARLGFRF